MSKWANVLSGCDQNSLSSYTPVAKWGRQQGFGRRQQHDPKADYLQRWRSLAPRSAEVNLCVCVPHHMSEEHADAEARLDRPLDPFQFTLHRSSSGGGNSGSDWLSSVCATAPSARACTRCFFDPRAPANAAGLSRVLRRCEGREGAQNSGNLHDFLIQISSEV